MFLTPRALVCLVVLGMLPACTGDENDDSANGGAAGGGSGGAVMSGGAGGNNGTQTGGKGGVAVCPEERLPTDVSGLVVSYVVFAGKKLTLVNAGDVELSAKDLWVCNGSRCESLESVTTLAAGAELSARVFVPRLAPEGGEIAVYRGNDFREASKMLAYLRWGRPEEEGRVSVAVAAKLWPSASESVPVAAGTPGLVIVGRPGAASGYAALPPECTINP